MPHQREHQLFVKTPSVHLFREGDQGRQTEYLPSGRDNGRDTREAGVTTSQERSGTTSRSHAHQEEETLHTLRPVFLELEQKEDKPKAKSTREDGHASWIPTPEDGKDDGAQRVRRCFLGNHGLGTREGQDTEARRRWQHQARDQGGHEAEDRRSQAAGTRNTTATRSQSAAGKGRTSSASAQEPWHDAEPCWRTTPGSRGGPPLRLAPPVDQTRPKRVPASTKRGNKLGRKTGDEVPKDRQGHGPGHQVKKMNDE